MQRLQQDMTRAPACASEQLRPQGETSSEAETVDDTSQTGSEGTADQDSSMAEGVAEGVSGLLQMNSGLSKDMVCVCSANNQALLPRCEVYQNCVLALLAHSYNLFVLYLLLPRLQVSDIQSFAQLSCNR